MTEKQVIKVYDKDGVYRSMAADPKTTAKDVVALFVKKLLREGTEGASPENFKLFIDFPDGSMLITASFFLLLVSY